MRCVRCARIRYCVRIARNSPSPSPFAEQAGPALFGLVRFWSRRWMQHGSAPDDTVVDIAVLEAVDTGERHGDTSVAAVAAQLGVDRSGASRMITRTAERGLLDKVADDEDQRRVRLHPTTAGRELLRDARAWQAATFEDLVADWPPADAEQFATHLVRLADHVLHQGQP